MICESEPRAETPLDVYAKGYRPLIRRSENNEVRLGWWCLVTAQSCDPSVEAFDKPPSSPVFTPKAKMTAPQFGTILTSPACSRRWMASITAI